MTQIYVELIIIIVGVVFDVDVVTMEVGT